MSWLGYEILLGPFIRAFCDRAGQLSADRFLAFRSGHASRPIAKISELDRLRSENAEFKVKISEAVVKIEQYHQLVQHLTSMLSECKPAFVVDVRYLAAKRSVEVSN